MIQIPPEHLDYLKKARGSGQRFLEFVHCVEGKSGKFFAMTDRYRIHLVPTTEGTPGMAYEIADGGLVSLGTYLYTVADDLVKCDTSKYTRVHGIETNSIHLPKSPVELKLTKTPDAPILYEETPGCILLNRDWLKGAITKLDYALLGEPLDPFFVFNKDGSFGVLKPMDLTAYREDR